MLNVSVKNISMVALLLVLSAHLSATDIYEELKLDIPELSKTDGGEFFNNFAECVYMKSGKSEYVSCTSEHPLNPKSATCQFNKILKISSTGGDYEKIRFPRKTFNEGVDVYRHLGTFWDNKVKIFAVFDPKGKERNVVCHRTQPK